MFGHDIRRNKTCTVPACYVGGDNLFNLWCAGVSVTLVLIPLQDSGLQCMVHKRLPKHPELAQKGVLVHVPKGQCLVLPATVHVSLGFTSAFDGSIFYFF